jgi:hypothetical protein
MMHVGLNKQHPGMQLMKTFRFIVRAIMVPGQFTFLKVRLVVASDIGEAWRRVIAEVSRDPEFKFIYQIEAVLEMADDWKCK